MRLLPIKSKFVTLLKLFSIIIFTFSFVSVNIPIVVDALSLQEELEKVQQELEQIRNTKKNLEQDISKEKSLQNSYEQELVNLKNKIDLLSNKIDEKRLVIKELELEIELLTNKLEETETEINTAETELYDLENETNTRLVDMYLSQKTFSELNMIVTPKGQSDVIKYNLYHNTIQDTTNTLVASLKDKRVILEGIKVGLEEDKIKVLRDEVQLKEELLALERDEADLNSTRSIYSSKRQQSIAKVENNSNTVEQLSEEEKIKSAERERIRQLLFKSISQLPDGTPLTGPNWQDIIIGMEGDTGLANGVHLHFNVYYDNQLQNPCSYLPAKSLRTTFLEGYPNTTCGVSNPKLTQWPMKGSNFDWTSPYGPRWGSFHYAIDISTKGYNESSPIYAAHPGYLAYKVDQYGGKYAVVCENKNCLVGFKTIYLHLK